VRLVPQGLGEPDLPSKLGGLILEASSLPVPTQFLAGSSFANEIAENESNPAENY